MPWRIRGIIEGFYGRPWSWDERIEVMRHCLERGMTHYVYAPKDDPKHRERWRDPYDADELHGFERLLAEGGLNVGFAISPGLSIDYRSLDDRHALAAKVDQVVELGVDLICLALDDIPNRPGLGEDHAELTTFLWEHLGDRAGLLLVPTEYVGSRWTPYLYALAGGVPEDVPIAWTGMAVVNDTITQADARARAASLGGRRPLLWDNYPVNDAVMGDRLFMGPLWGRDPDLVDACCGYLANPMVQPHSSKLPLASAAAYLRGEDPLTAWAEEAEAAGLRVFAEACDGSVPQALVQALADEDGGMGWADAAVPLAAWLEAATEAEAPGLEDEAAPWVEQVRKEAKVGLAALRLLEATRPLVRIDDTGAGRVVGVDTDAVLDLAFGLAARWPTVRRAEHTVMGPRCSVRPVIVQRGDGAWAFDRAAVQEDENAVDALVRLALDAAAAVGPSEPVRVMADGAEVAVDRDGTFTVSEDAVVLARCGAALTRARVPCRPPLTRSRV
jgi:hyaluronoglucosaminidase